MNLKKKLGDPGKRLSMEVCTIPSPVVTQAIAAAGTDAVIIDQEHGAVGRESLHAMVAATAGTDCAPLVRIVEYSAANVKVALDMGAEGIVFPLAKTAEDVRNCVASLRYPPKGIRGWGPFIGHSRWHTPIMDYLPTLGENTVCCILIETPEAVENIDEIFDVEGVDFAVVAQFDLSTTLGISGQFAHPEFLESVATIEKAAFKSGIPLCGGPVRSSEEAEEFFAKGYRIIGGFDILRLKASIQETVAWVRTNSA